MIRSRTQLERTALNLLRQAMALGWSSDALMIDFAVQAMGEDHRALIDRVHAREFRNFMGAG
jgi:predicted transglutaminase-like cysteine proteinase